MRKIRTPLFSALLMMILCASIVIGSTYAHFTDNVQVTGNVVASGNLKAGLEWAETLPTDESQWQDASQGIVFNETRWEPNYTAARYVRISNRGDLAFQYELNVVPTLMVEGEANLLDVIEVYFGTVAEGESITRANYAEKLTRVGVMSDLISNEHGAGYGILLPIKKSDSAELPQGVEAATGSVTACLVLHMQEEAGNEYMGLSAGEGFSLQLVATQYTYEKDAFGNLYDQGATLPDVSVPTRVTVAVTPDANGNVPADVTLSTSAGVTALVPAGAQMTEGATSLTLIVAPKAQSDANLTLSANETLQAWEVKVVGLAATNQVPVQIHMGEAMAKGLNIGNYSLYHLENGVANTMTRVEQIDSASAHNSFSYDPATGEVSLAMATFSEVAAVADAEAKWEGKFAITFNGGNGTEQDPYIIANADQLAYLADQVSNDNENYGGKFYKLVADINIGGEENSNHIWYPIGYRKQGTGSNKAGESLWYTYGGAFTGTFDGNGHKITGIYQNTWAMDGNYDNGYWNEAMGLFGYVNGGTIKNLTIDNFKSEGEFAPTGCIAAYADGNATFENISIVNSHPQTYNTGVACIVGWDNGGDTETEASNFTFKNITIDSSNTVSALWGSWDVAAAGVLGYLGEHSKVTMDNCNVSATIDVYNDVCGNYQYYWYRYCGMLIGTVDKTDTDGNLDLSNITATNCSVNFGDRHEYFYCEFVKNSLASYTHDYQFSRVAHSELEFNDTNNNGKVDTTDEKESVTGCTHDHAESGYETTDIDKDGDIDNDILKEDKQAVYLPFYQLFGGYGWGVDGIDVKEYNNLDIKVDRIEETDYEGSVPKFEVVDPENNEYCTGDKVTIGEIFNAISDVIPAIEVDKVQVFVSPVGEDSTVSGTYVANATDWTQGTLTFSGTGKATVTITDYYYCTATTISVNITERVEEEKFESKFTGDFLYRVGNQNAVKLDSLFKAKDDMDIGTVSVTVENVAGNASGTYDKDASDWTNGTIKFSDTGVVKVTITDDDYCKPTELYLEVVEATNLTSATGGTGKNFVLLQDVTYSETYLYYKNSTVYGNGFTIDITGADHSDLKDSSDTNSNKSAYCNIWMVDSRLDNVKIVGSVYPEVGMTADSDYGNAAIRTEGNCFITNSYISNTRVPLRVQGNTTLEDTVVDGGRYANIELRSGKLVLDGVTTINTVRKGSDGTTDVIGFGIVIHNEAANASISVIGEGLKQYNWAGENKHKTILSGDTYLSNAYKLIFNANNSASIYFTYDNDRYVNTGILCLCGDMGKDVVTGLDDRYCQEVSGYDAWVLTYDNSKHTEWFNESVSEETVSFDPKQDSVIPNYTGNAAQTVEFTKGETYYFDTSVLSAEKYGNTLTISSVVMNGTTYNYGEKIPFTEGGVYEVVYTVVDPYNYNADATVATPVNHEVTITVTAIAKDAEILAPKFTFIDQNGNKYESTTVKVGDKTYVMPNVTAADQTTNPMSSINIGSASISGTTVYFPVATGDTVRSGSNFNRYYPLFNGINITDYTVAGDTTGTTYTTSGNYTSLVGSSGTKFIIPANGGQTNCGDYVKTDGQAGNAAGNSDSGWQGAGYSTSYGGTYLKSGNTNASSGADSNGYERIVWIEYSFNAGNGDVYYYRIGYHCDEEPAQSSCVTPDTLVTLADGSKKEIQHVTYNDQLLVWDFFNGQYAAVPSAIIFNHGEGEFNVIHLSFEDGTVVKVIAEHRFLDAATNEFVRIDEFNAQDYIGHSFYKQDGQGFTTVKLVDAVVKTEHSVAYSLISAKHYNFFVEDLFSSPFLEKDVGAFEYFDIAKDELKYTNVEEDIAKYGLYSYDEFAPYITQEQYDAFNAQYMKIAVGKGDFTFEEILRMIGEYLQ